MEQIFHPYEKWEEYHAGMWRTLGGKDRDVMAVAVYEFMRGECFYAAMKRVTSEWTYSCEQNLTNGSINRVAWLGQAAACLALGCPEDLTRIVWHTLTDRERAVADDEADAAIFEWERKHLEKINAETLLFR